VGAKERVRSVCLVTKGGELDDVKTVSLDVSSKTSVVLTKIIFREFLGLEPEWRNAAPNIDAMLAESDAALLIGDPALSITDSSLHHRSEPGAVATGLSHRKFDLVELWKKYTDLGFVFAMWMSRKETCPIDFAAARDEGLAHIGEIATNYQTEIPIGLKNLVTYLSENISYSVDDSMQKGLELYFDLAQKNGLIDKNKPLEFTVL